MNEGLIGRETDVDHGICTVGDEVWLASGSPAMRIENFIPEKILMVKLTWLDKRGDAQYNTLPAACLRTKPQPVFTGR